MNESIALVDRGAPINERNDDVPHDLHAYEQHDGKHKEHHLLWHDIRGVRWQHGGKVEAKRPNEADEHAPQTFFLKREIHSITLFDD
jgi:hypothetical protein